MHGSTSGIKPQFLTCFHLVCREEQHRLGKVVPAPAMQLPMPLAHLPAKQARKRQHPKVVVCTECLEVSSRIHAHCKATMKHYSQVFIWTMHFMWCHLPGCINSLSSTLFGLSLHVLPFRVNATPMHLKVNATPSQCNSNATLINEYNSNTVSSPA